MRKNELPELITRKKLYIYKYFYSFKLYLVRLLKN